MIINERATILVVARNETDLKNIKFQNKVLRGCAFGNTRGHVTICFNLILQFTHIVN